MNATIMKISVRMATVQTRLGALCVHATKALCLTRQEQAALVSWREIK